MERTTIDDEVVRRRIQGDRGMILIAVAAGVFGLMIGSFLNVVIYRVPAGMSIVSPPSACPNCGSGIAAYDNVPVASWIVLRGRCRNCRTPISARYPLVELGTGVAFFVVALPFASMILTAASVSGFLVLLAFLYFAAISVALSLIDLDTHKLPNAIVLPAYIVGFVLLAGSSIAANDYGALIRGVIGMATLGLAYLAVALIRPGGMGLGDVKLAGVIGLFLGWVGWGALIVGSFSAVLLGGLFGLVLIALKRRDRSAGIPFGPWMVVGAWLGIFFGASIWTDYLSTFGLTS
jgi:leader peptidase (prepilin peptidase)/N-methyltransferase